MSGALYLFDPADRFVAGTVGQPGERAFYLQARTGARVSSVLLEKDQVAAMAERLGLLLRELKRSDSTFHFDSISMDDAPLESPVLEEFRVGAISLSWLNDRGMIAIELHSVSENAEQSELENPLETVDESTDIMRVVITLLVRRLLMLCWTELESWLTIALGYKDF